MIARHEAILPYLRERLTEEAVAQYFSHVFNGQTGPNGKLVQRFDLILQNSTNAFIFLSPYNRWMGDFQSCISFNSFQSYQDDGRVIMKGILCKGSLLLLKRFQLPEGIDLVPARSVGQQ